MTINYSHRLSGDQFISALSGTTSEKEQTVILKNELSFAFDGTDSSSGGVNSSHFHIDSFDTPPNKSASSANAVVSRTEKHQSIITLDCLYEHTFGKNTLFVFDLDEVLVTIDRKGDFSLGEYMICKPTYKLTEEKLGENLHTLIQFLKEKNPDSQVIVLTNSHKGVSEKLQSAGCDVGWFDSIETRTLWENPDEVTKGVRLTRYIEKTQRTFERVCMVDDEVKNLDSVASEIKTDFTGFHYLGDLQNKYLLKAEIENVKAKRYKFKNLEDYRLENSEANADFAMEKSLRSIY